MHRGYEAREEKEKNRTRHIMAYVKAFGGMGSTEAVQIADIWPLKMDKTDEKKMITTMKQAMAMLRDFNDALV